MDIYVDATPLYNLGQIGELDLIPVFDGTVIIPQAVVEEITVEPAATNLERLLAEHPIETDPAIEEWTDDAKRLLDTTELTSDVALTACLLAARDRGGEYALVSDDRRMRAIADGLGATVTGTFGITVRASMDDKYFSLGQAKRVIRRTDHHGVQMTGQLRERAVGEIK